MKKVLEKILEDELFKKEKFEGTGYVTINNTSKDEKLKLEVSKNAKAETNDINVLVCNKNILKFEDLSSNGITYHDTNKITIKNPTSYLYATQNFSKIRNLVKGKKVTGTWIINGTISQGSGISGLEMIFTTNKSRRLQCNITANNSPYNNYKYTTTINLAEDEYFATFNSYIYNPITCDLEIEVQIEISEQATDIVKHEEQLITLQDKQKTSAFEYEDITHIICTDELACNFNVSAKTSIIKKITEQMKSISPTNEVSLESLEALHTHTHTDITT